MQKIVGVSFNPGGKVYYFNPCGLELKVGDNVIVETVAGLQFGTVNFAEREILNKKLDNLKSVIRIATAIDKKKKSELDLKTAKAREIVKEKIAKFKLPMKVCEVSYTFDGAKLIVEFTAEDRVDFRELLKDLASTFKVRIELKQIGQRDEVKIKGGLGPCGEICCCKRFLEDFEHVTVKMAKTQGLSLSPSKINGLCGRLMCCLAYENKNYEEVLKKMPKINSEVITPKGKGICSFCDVLRELVSVKLTLPDGSVNIEEYKLDDIEFKPLEDKKNGI